MFFVLFLLFHVSSIGKWLPHVVFIEMGQEKSLPSRCNSIHNYPLTGTHHHNHHHHHHHQTLSGPTTLSSAASSVSLARSAVSNTSTVHTNCSRATYKSVERQTKYLKEQLYIKSYLDLEEQDRNAKKLFQQTTKSGIRNYTPKILGEKQLNDNNNNCYGSSSNLNTLTSQSSSLGGSNSNTLTKKDVDVWI